MAYLIDGHNLIPKLPGFSLQAVEDEMQLVEWLQVFCRQSHKKVEVFFDNAPPGYAGARRFGPVTARFVTRSSSADAAIGKRLAQLGAEARNWTVVTSDHQVQAEAHAAHARVVPAEEFARQVVRAMSASPPKTTGGQPSLSPAELSEWLALFGEDEPE